MINFSKEHSLASIPGNTYNSLGFFTNVNNKSKTMCRHL